MTENQQREYHEAAVRMEREFHWHREFYPLLRGLVRRLRKQARGRRARSRKRARQRATAR